MSSIWLADARASGPAQPWHPRPPILAACLAGFGVLLFAIAGFPRLPGRVPSPGEISVFLQSADAVTALTPATVVPAVVALGWLVWAWAVWSFLVELGLTAVEALSHGAAWVGTARAVTGRVTLPLGRRVVKGAVAAAVVANVARSIPIAAAAPPVAASAQPALVDDHAPASSSRPATPQTETTPSTSYTVRKGDTLWGISARFYGAGEQYERIVAANVGRRMADGRTFPRSAVIRPGWVLIVPLSAAKASEEPGSAVYVVEPGDTLRGIAARLLGNAERWTEIYRLNQGRARLSDGRTLTDPDLIWPGLRLQLPVSPAADASHGSPIADPPAKPASAPPLQPALQPAASRPAREPAATIPAPPAIPTPDAPPEPANNPLVAIDPPNEVWVWPTIYGGVGILGAAVAAAALRARRRGRRRGDEADSLHRHAFVEPDPTRIFAYRLVSGEPEPTQVLASRITRELDETGARGVAVLAATMSHQHLALLLRTGPIDGVRLLECAAGVGRRLGGMALASPTRDHDVLLEIEGLSASGALVAPAEPIRSDLLFLPLGAVRSALEPQTLLANWRAIGNVLIVGGQAESVGKVLTSLIAGLVCRLPSTALQTWVVARPGTMLAQLSLFPHQVEASIEPGNHERLRSVVDRWREELRHRQERGTAEEAPDWVLVLGEADDLPGSEDDLWDSLDEMLRDGPKCRLRVIAVSNQAARLDARLIERCRTRLVTWLAKPEVSTVLAGHLGATTLGQNDVLAVIEGREAVCLRAFGVSDKSLAQLATLLARPRKSSSVRNETTVPSPPATSRDPSPAGPVEPAAYDGLDIPLRENGHSSNAEAAASAEVVFTDEARPAQVAPVLRVYCFGALTVLHQDREIRPIARNGQHLLQAWELLARIAVEPGGQVARETLWSALWPGDAVDADKVAHRLRTVAYFLRDVLASQVPETVGEILRNPRKGSWWLDPRLAWSDAQEFLALLAAASKQSAEEAEVSYQRARSLYQRGELLAGATYPWLDERDAQGLALREYYHEQYIRATDALGDLYLQSRRPAAAVPLYQELVKSDPSRPQYARRLFRCHRILGDRTGLTLAYHALQESLRRALETSDPVGGEPDRKTRLIYQKYLAELDRTDPIATTDGGMLPEEHGSS